MNKRAFILIMFIFVCSLLFSEVKYLSGQKNLSKLKGANPINVFLTFEGTIIYDVSIDVFVNING